MERRFSAPEFASRQVAVECGVVAAVLVVAYLWQRLVQRLAYVLAPTLDASGSIPLTGLVVGVVFVGGLALFVGGYVAYRGVEAGATVPSKGDGPLVVLAATGPPLFVGVTKLVGVATGVTYSSLTMTYYPVVKLSTPILVVVGLNALIAVPSLALLCQAVIQRSLERARANGRPVVATTLVAGFVMTNGTGALRPVPERGKLAGAIVFVALVGVAHYVSEAVERASLRYAAHAPVVLFVAVAFGSALARLDSLAAGAFGLTHLAVLAIAAYTYERSDSLAVPALAYLSLTVANYAVVLAFEMGVGPS